MPDAPVAVLLAVVSAALVAATCWAVAMTTAARHWYRVAAAEDRRSHRCRREAVAFIGPADETSDLSGGMP